MQRQYETAINRVLWWQTSCDQNTTTPSLSVVHFWRTRLELVTETCLLQIYGVCDNVIQSSQMFSKNTGSKAKEKSSVPLSITFHFMDSLSQPNRGNA
jgi:hypothetical protein